VARLQGDSLDVAEVSGKPGQCVPLRIRLQNTGAVKSVRVNGVRQEFVASTNAVSTVVRFAGEKYARELDSWLQTDGKRFDFPNPTAVEGISLSTAFSLPQEVRQLLTNAKPKNHAEMGEKIAEWQRNSAEQGSYYPQNYHNFVCERPERLWLVVPLLTPTDVKVTLNGKPVPSTFRDKASNSVFADITDLVDYPTENHLELSFRELTANAFMGPFLLYPAEAATTAVLSDAGPLEHRVVYRQSLVPSPALRYRRGDGPQIVEGKMAAHVTLTNVAQLQVKLNMPPEQIRRVLFFESGFPWMGQHPLQYDKALQCWTAEIRPGGRAQIQENEEIYVWAEGSDGLRSEYYPVKVAWDFVN
jgi:hypothetical protein